MIVIDGSQGEGGGQIFRTSLTLSMCLQKPVTVKNIRAGRRKPGLLRQHLTCLRAATEICGAIVSGDEIGSSEVSFEPGVVKPGEYHFSVGSAGSTTLVLQTVLLPLLMLNEKSEVMIEGGTHNQLAPSVEFIQKCFVPLLHKVGFEFDLELMRYGFFPAGGGAIKAHIKPVEKLRPLTLIERGAFRSVCVDAISAMIPSHVVEREIETVCRKTDWDRGKMQARTVESVGPGNIVSIAVKYENITEVFECIGERSLRAESVAKKAVLLAEEYMEKTVPVDEYLADQLLLPMVLAKGGIFRTKEPSEHTLTNILVIKAIANVDIALSENKKNEWEIKI